MIGLMRYANTLSDANQASATQSHSGTSDVPMFFYIIETYYHMNWKTYMKANGLSERLVYLFLELGLDSANLVLSQKSDRRNGNGGHPLESLRIKVDLLTD